MVMQRMIANYPSIMLALCLASCSPQVVSSTDISISSDPGWHHTWNEYRNFVRYGFTDQAHTVFAGTCDAAPIFMVFNGDYRLGAERFTVTIDDARWTLETFQGEHGRGLMLDDPAIVEALAKAKNLVRFQVDDGWTREFKPASDLSQMIEECRSLRKLDSNANGQLTHSKALVTAS